MILLELVELKMNIINEEGGWYDLLISGELGESIVRFSPELKEVRFDTDTPFGMFLNTHAYQMNKLLRNKRPRSYYVGFKLTFILWINKDVEGFNDRSKIVVVDRRKGKYECYATNETDETIDCFYIDGSYLEETEQGGFTILHKNKKGVYEIHTVSVKAPGSNRVELLAAIETLRRFRYLKKLRLITDSQYVRKGLSEWLICWMRNDFMTANGEKAKNIDLWTEAEQLTKDLYIELQWVKAHSDHFENTICDLYAKDTAIKSKALRHIPKTPNR